MNAETTETCAHRWRIAPPNGRTTLGTCSKCGLTKQHRNSTDDTLFGLENAGGTGWAFQRRAELRAAGMRGPVRS